MDTPYFCFTINAVAVALVPLQWATDISEVRIVGKVIAFIRGADTV